MPDASVGSVSLKITASSKSASNAVSTLADSLKRLKAATEGVDVAGIASIGTAMQTLSASTAGVKTSGTALRSLARTVESLKTMDLGNLPASFEALSASVAGFSGFTGMLAQVKEFSKSITSLNSAFKRAGTMDVENLAPKLQEVASALRPLTDEMLRGGAGVANYGTQVKDLAAGLTQLTKSANAAGRSSTQLSGFQKAMNFAALTAKVLSTYYVIRRITSLLQSAFTNISSYIENMNLFAVAMGDAADEGKNLAEKMQSVLGVDPGEAERYMGVFNNLLTTFGNSSAAAKTMSENLTQLGYDLSSFYNISTSDAFEKLQSGITGQTKPLRELGIDISEARLQQELYALGIQATYANLSQADKAQLRYIAVMKQSSNALGDLGRTLDSPMNQMRVLEAQFTILGRAVGSVFIPALTRIIPVVTAVVEILAQGFSALASFFGFDLSKYVNAETTQTISAGYEDVSDSLDDVGSSASSTAKDMKTLISGFDELNVLQKKSTSAGTSKGGAGNLLSGLNLPTYDMFQNAAKSKVVKLVDDMKKKLKSLYDTIVPFIPAIKGLAVEFAGLLILSKIVPLAAKFLEAFGITGSAAALFKYGTTIAVVAGEFTAFYSLAKAVASGTLDMRDAFVVGALAFTGFGLALSSLLGPVGWVVTGITALIAVIAGANDGIAAQNQAIIDSELYKNGGVPITEISDAYKSFTDSLSASTTAISAVSDSYNQNNQTIEDSRAKLATYQATLDALGSNVSDQFVPNVKAAFDDMANAISANMESTRIALIGALVNAPDYIQQQLGVSIPDITNTILEATGKVDQKSKELQQQFADVYAQWQDNQGSTALIQQMIDISSEMYGLSDTGGQAIDDFNAKLNTIGKVDFASADEAEAALQSIQDAAQQTKDSIDTSQQQMTKMIDDLVAKGGLTETQGASMKSLYDKMFTLEKQDVLQKEQTAIDTISQSYNDIVKQGAEQAKPGIGDYLSAFTGWIFTGDWTKPSQIKQWAQASAAQSAISTALTDEVGSAITSAKTGVKSELDELGKYIAEGMGVGITSNLSSVKDAASGMADAAIDTAKTESGVASPSKKTMEIGRYVTEGLALGISDSGASAKVSTSVTTVVSGMLTKISTALAPTVTTQYGRNFGTGIATGISASASSTAAAVTNLADGARNMANSTLSSVNGQTSGSNFGYGIMNGINSRAWDVRSATANMMSQVSSAVREAIRDMQDYANSNPVTITVNTRSTSSYGRSYKPHLADGGVAYGTSDVQIGEYQGAATNPEIVAPQSVMAETVQAANAPMTVAIVEAVMKVVDAVNAKDTTVVVGDDAIGTATTRYASRAKSRTGVNPITSV